METIHCLSTIGKTETSLDQMLIIESRLLLLKTVRSSGTQLSSGLGGARRHLVATGDWPALVAGPWNIQVQRMGGWLCFAAGLFFFFKLLKPTALEVSPLWEMAVLVLPPS